MTPVDLTLRLVRLNGSDLVAFDPGSATVAVWQTLDLIGQKTNGYYRVQISRPFRPRTTGPRSQSARFRGHCDDLSQQVPGGYSPTEIADAMKRMAVEYGYRTRLSVDGIETPVSEGDLSVEEEGLLLRVQQRYADIHGFWLTEYIDSEHPEKGVYKSVGGRSYEEMIEYWKRLGKGEIG